MLFHLLTLSSLTAVCAMKQANTFSSPLLERLNGKHEIVRPRELNGKHENSDFPQESSFKVQAYGKEFHVELQRNEVLFSRGHETVHMNGKSEVVSSTKGTPEAHCYYQGNVKGDADSYVALSTCNGLHGTISAHGETLAIEPAHWHSDQLQVMSEGSTVTQDHIVFRHSDAHVQGTYEMRDTKKYSLDELQDIVAMKTKSSELNADQAMLMYMEQAVAGNEAKRAKGRKLLDVESHYVELIVVIDKAFNKLHGEGEKAKQYARSMVNHVDNQYRVIGKKAGMKPLRVLLTQLIVWDSNPINPDSKGADGEVDPDDYLTKFGRWVYSNFVKVANPAQFDNAQLFSGEDFSYTILGIANTAKMCDIDTGSETLSSGANQATIFLGQDANTVAHEMGHNFGLRHDGTSNTCPKSGYVMAAISSGPEYTWSKCSIDKFNEYYEQLTCNKLTETKSIKICGNGVTEEGEQCDCGGEEGCKDDPCCDGTKCMLKGDAKCSAVNQCCDKATCTIKETGAVCRSKTDAFCDVVEKCDGISQVCPDDLFAEQGKACQDSYKDQGACWNGKCSNRMQSCLEVKTRAGTQQYFGGVCTQEKKDFLEKELQENGGCHPFRCYNSKDYTYLCDEFSSVVFRDVGFRRGFPCGVQKHGVYDRVCSGGLRNDGILSKCVTLKEAADFSEEIEDYEKDDCQTKVFPTQCYDPFVKCKENAHGQIKARCDCYPIYAACMVKLGCFGFHSPNDVVRTDIHKTGCETLCDAQYADTCFVKGVDDKKTKWPTAPTGQAPPTAPTKKPTTSQPTSPTPAPDTPPPTTSSPSTKAGSTSSPTSSTTVGSTSSPTIPIETSGATAVVPLTVAAVLVTAMCRL